MPRKYPFFPAWDGKQASPLILRVAQLLQRRYPGTRNLGTYVNRDMRGKPGVKSTHATGYALDLGYQDEAQARLIWDELLAHSKDLGICELHWYKFGKHGAGYRCSRGENKQGVVIYQDAASSAGTGGAWLHLEVDNNFGRPGGDPDAWEKAFRATRQ